MKASHTARLAGILACMFLAATAGEHFAEEMTTQPKPRAIPNTPLVMKDGSTVKFRLMTLPQAADTRGTPDSQESSATGVAAARIPSASLHLIRCVRLDDTVCRLEWDYHGGTRVAWTTLPFGEFEVPGEYQVEDRRHRMFMMVLDLRASAARKQLPPERQPSGLQRDSLLAAAREGRHQLVFEPPATPTPEDMTEQAVRDLHVYYAQHRGKLHERREAARALSERNLAEQKARAGKPREVLVHLFEVPGSLRERIIRKEETRP